MGLQRAQDELQALIDSSPLALVEFALDTRILLWNPAAERIFGWTREEMLDRGGLPMAPPHKRDESETLWARVIGGESLNDLETVRQRKDGSLVDVSIAAAPVRDGSGRVVGNMVAYTAITERKAQDQEAGGPGRHGHEARNDSPCDHDARDPQPRTDFLQDDVARYFEYRVA